MNMLRYFLLVAVFLALATGSHAQTRVLYKHSELKSYVVHLQQTNRNEHNISNYIIRELAQGNNTRLERTEYSFRFLYEVQVTRRGNRLVTHVDLRSFRFSGDMHYMGFDISDILLPSQVEFTANLYQEDKHITQLQQRPASINPDRNRYTLEYTDSLTNDNNLKLIIPEFTFHFTSHNRSSFNNRITLINEYYSMDAYLQQMYDVLQSLDIYNLDYISENQQHLQYIHARIVQLQSRDFFNKLNLREYDPIALASKTNDIMSLHYEQAQHMDYVMENLHVLYYQRGMDLSTSNPQKARENFHASLSVNSNFAPAMLEMANSYFYSANNIKESISWIQRAYRVGYRDNETESSLQQLSHEVNDILIKNAQDFERKNNHHAALQAWKIAEEFCLNVSSVSCPNQISRGIVQAHMGIYNGMISEGHQLHNQNNLQQAEELAQQAIAYQKNNNRYVTSDKDAVRLLNEIKNRQYKNFVEQGRRDMSRQSYRNALHAFENAMHIQLNFPVEQEHQLGELVKKAKRPLLVIDIEAASTAVERNQLRQANDIIGKIQEDINHYDFYADNEINAALNSVRKNLQSQHCVNIQNLMEQLLSQANQLILEGKFLAAEENFQEIIYHNSNNSTCGFSLQTMERRRAEVLPAIIYQQHIEEVKQLVQARRFGRAIDIYNDAGRQFQQYSVHRFRLEHKPLDEFCKAFHDDFSLYVAQLLANLGEGAKALNLVYYLETNNYPARQMRAVQETTGRILAREDASQNPTWKPRQKVREYTHRNRNLRFLRRAYVKQFRRSR